MKSARTVDRRRSTGWLVLPALLLAWSCSAPPDSLDAIAMDSVAVATELEPTQAEVRQVVPPNDDPFSTFMVDTAKDVVATVRITPVWIVNDSAEPLIFSARAGAGAVVVDTVDAADSVFVRLETRADSVVLSARTAAGSPAGELALIMDSVPGRIAFPH